jgi:hypothetical protein
MTCNPRTSRSCAATRRDKPLCVYELLPRLLLSEPCLGHFIGHRLDFARNIVAGIAGLGVSNDGWERKSTISQEGSSRNSSLLACGRRALQHRLP